ncbi:hypothetical protein N2603_39075 [Bradyrhizobium huanghuaihaiense]|uniref:hypothetical protein n=1 Tax=Bradyrhizobium huanghuaihaiense TaxID=990078 RepID=UPI0021AA1A74|nr:hypothetical protein [Bradyrhizobium sp. CB3035]UWU75889.1 hypothetical protein N2603_39075 [Bradyrhizobium sp. CB3035]
MLREYLIASAAKLVRSSNLARGANRTILLLNIPITEGRALLSSCIALSDGGRVLSQMEPAPTRTQ